MSAEVEKVLAEVLREAARQARAEAQTQRDIAPHLTEMYGSDQGALITARRHDAVADLLEREAEVTEEMAALNPDYAMGPNDPALAVARAYLGEQR